MELNNQNDIDKLIESFKESNPDYNNIYKNPPVESIIEEVQKYDYDHSTYTEQAQIRRYNSYIENRISSNNNIFYWPNIESPFFTDEEVEEFRDYYSKSGEESYHDYFDENMTAYIASGSNKTTKSYGSKIIDLQNQIKNSDSQDEIDSLKQNILDLGWNPEVDYTAESQIMARNRFISLMSEKMCKVDIFDITPLVEETNDQISFSEANIRSMFPISLVFVKGESFVTPIISAVTHSDFSHAALALDGDFTKLYSFNFYNNIRPGGGFSLESYKNYPKDKRFAVYTFFVNKEDYDKLSAKLQYLLNNIKNTIYSSINLVLFPFKNIKFNSPFSMICSQFVDACMKMINIDITSVDSSKVSPGYLYTSAVKNAKIYKIFDGFVKDFNENKVRAYLKKISTKAKLIKSESVNYIEPVIVATEAREFPIKVNKDGDVLLTNPFPDFDSEYMASHKLLMQYDKNNNIEPMKYELSRLYYMNYILEKRLYHNKFLINKEKNMKTRARVLNDFNKYIKVVLKAEPNFNFAKYYEQSPFYPHTVEVKGTTINSIKNILKYI